MSERQISEMIGNMVRHQHCFGGMSTEDRQWTINNTGEAIGLFANAVKTRASAEVMKLLEFVEPITLAAVDTFTIALCEGETIDGLRIGYLGPNLKQNFLNKVERPVAAREGRHHKLVVNDSFDSAIITELGGDRVVEVSFGQFWKFLTTANQSLWYVAYIRDKHNVLWAVDAYWNGDKLYLEAFSLGCDYGWIADVRFVSA